MSLWWMSIYPTAWVIGNFLGYLWTQRGNPFNWRAFVAPWVYFHWRDQR